MANPSIKFTGISVSTLRVKIDAFEEIFGVTPEIYVSGEIEFETGEKINIRKSGGIRVGEIKYKYIFLEEIYKRISNKGKNPQIKLTDNTTFILKCKKLIRSFG